MHMQQELQASESQPQVFASTQALQCGRHNDCFKLVKRCLPCTILLLPTGGPIGSVIGAAAGGLAGAVAGGTVASQRGPEGAAIDMSKVATNAGEVVLANACNLSNMAYACSALAGVSEAHLAVVLPHLSCCSAAHGFASVLGIC
jgi:hypothetical protein